MPTEDICAERESEASLLVDRLSNILAVSKDINATAIELTSVLFEAEPPQIKNDAATKELNNDGLFARIFVTIKSIQAVQEYTIELLHRLCSRCSH